MSNTTPAGWFPDPQVPGQQRYWNGVAWTEHTAPLHQPTHHLVGARPPAERLTTSAGSPALGHKNWFIQHPVLSGIAALFLIVVIAAAATGGGAENDQDQDVVAADTEPGDADGSPATSAPTSSTTEPTPEPEPVDTDSDGVTDEADFLPEDPKVQEPMDVDTDGDGVADPIDDFPEDAEVQQGQRRRRSCRSARRLPPRRPIPPGH